MTATDDVTTSGLAQLGELLKAVRRRWLLVVIVVVAASGTALALTLRQTEQYDAVSKVFISQSNPVGSVLARGGSGPADPERDFNTRVQLIKEPNVAERVRRELRLELSDDELLAKIRTEVAATSDIASIHARDPDPRQAAAIANAFARNYAEVRQEAVRERVLQAVSLAARQLSSLSLDEQAAPAGRELARRLRELQVDAALQTSGVEVVSLARPPTSPAAPRPILTTMLAALLAALLGVALAVVLELGDRRIKEEADLDAFGLALLGAVPQGRDGPGTDDPAVREAFSTVATNVRFLNLRRDVSSLILTSPGPREDKTSVILGLARALSELGLAVIAIEADLRRPRFAGELGISPAAGLSTVLAGFGELDDVLVEVDARTLRALGDDVVSEGPSFSAIAGGPVAASPLPLLASPTMSQVIGRARQLAEVVILDAAPVGPVGDAVTLAELVDGIVVVAKLGHTHQDALQRALRTLADVQAPTLGLVVTNAPRPERTWYGSERATRTRGAISS